MTFDALDHALRRYETASDRCLPLGGWAMVRLDGRGFTRFTKSTERFEKPFDPQVHAWMVDVTRGLMSCGMRVLLGYTQSDEISLLLHPSDQTFGRKTRKLLSIFAGEASGRMSLLAGEPVAFDARISELPDLDRVVDYVRWRHEDARRNALTSTCFWRICLAGEAPAAAEAQVRGLSTEAMRAMLAQTGAPWEALPDWQRAGSLVFHTSEAAEGLNPLSGTVETTERRRIASAAAPEDGRALDAWLRARLGAESFAAPQVAARRFAGS